MCQQILVKLSNFTEIRPVAAAQIHAVTWAERHEEANMRYSRLSESA